MNTTFKTTLCVNKTVLADCPLSNEFGQAFLAAWSKVQPLLYSFMFLTLSAAVVSNVLLILSVIKNPHCRTMANLFLCNIAVADTMYALINVVGEALFLVWDDRRQQQEVCFKTRLLSIRFLTYAVSMFSMVALSFERFYAICSPYSFLSFGHHKNKLKLAGLVAIWISAAAITGPMGLCSPIGKPYAIFLSCVLLVLPLLVMIATFWKISKALRTTVAPAAVQPNQSRGRIVILLCAMLVAILILWTPYNALFLYRVFNDAPKSMVVLIWFWIAFIVGSILTYIHCVVNPILYLVFCKDFRSGLKSLFSGCFHIP